MKRIVYFLAYGAAVLTTLFALALPVKILPIFVSFVGALDLKIAPWFSGGEVAWVLDRGSHQIKVYHPVYPALVGEGKKGFVQLVWQPRGALPLTVQEAIDLNRDGSVDCEISFPNPASEEAVPLLTVIPKSPWVLPVQNSPTTSLSEVLIEKGREAIFIRIPVLKRDSSGTDYFRR
jgi:hypothetical protein